MPSGACRPWGWQGHRNPGDGYLQFEAGDLIIVTEKADNGYFSGNLPRSGAEGVFPGILVAHGAA